MALKYLSISNLSTVWTKIKAYLSSNYQPKGSYLTSHQDISGLETKANAITGLSVSGTTFSLTKANVVGALGYTPPTSNTTYSAGSNMSLSGTKFSTSSTPTFSNVTVTNNSSNGLLFGSYRVYVG